MEVTHSKQFRTSWVVGAHRSTDIIGEIGKKMLPEGWTPESLEIAGGNEFSIVFEYQGDEMPNQKDIDSIQRILEEI